MSRAPRSWTPRIDQLRDLHVAPRSPTRPCARTAATPTISRRRAHRPPDRAAGPGRPVPRYASAGDLAWSLLAGAAAPDALGVARRRDRRAGGAAARARGVARGRAADRRATPDRGRRLRRARGPVPLATHRRRSSGTACATASTPPSTRPAARGARARRGLRATCEGRPDRLLAAAFPGASGALTALRTTVAGDPPHGRDAGDHGAAGRPPTETWHLYLERGAVVRTRTSVAVAAATPTAAAGAVRVPVLRGARSMSATGSRRPRW